MCHDPNLGETKYASEGGQIFTVHIRRAIRRSFRAHYVRIVIPATVRYGAIVDRKFRKLLAPHAIILQATVNKDHRLTLTLLDIGKLVAVDRYSLDFVGHGGRVAKGQGNDQSKERTDKGFAKRHCHLIEN